MPEDDERPDEEASEEGGRDEYARSQEEGQQAPQDAQRTDGNQPDGHERQPRSGQRPRDQPPHGQSARGQGRRSQGQPGRGQPAQGQGQPAGQPSQSHPARGQGQPGQGGPGQPAQGQAQPPQGQPAGQPGQQGPAQGGQGQPGHGQPGQQPGQGPPGAHPHHSGGIDVADLPWVSGLVNGIAYFITAYIVASLVFVGDLVNALGDAFDPGDDFLTYGLGWKFYDNHFVNVPEDFSIVSDQLTIPEFGYTLIPAGFLFLAGRSVARTHAREHLSSTELAAYGATVVAGYLPLAVIGATLLENNGQSPDMGSAILLMGLVFPVVCGGLGGYLARR